MVTLFLISHASDSDVCSSNEPMSSHVSPKPHFVKGYKIKCLTKLKNQLKKGN